MRTHVTTEVSTKCRKQEIWFMMGYICLKIIYYNKSESDPSPDPHGSRAALPHITLVSLYT